MTLSEIRERIERTRAGLRTALDPERRKTALAEVLAPFKKGGPYYHVPAKVARIPAEQKFLSDELFEANKALYHFERSLLDVAPLVDTMKAKSMRPPSVEDNWLSRTGKGGVSPTEYLGLLQLDEVRRMRLSSELKALGPGRVSAMYAEALADPDEQSNGAVIRLVEEMHGGGWSGPAVPDSELGNLQQLRRQIADARQARIPDEIRQLETLVEQGRIEVQHAKALHKLTPLNPAHLAPVNTDDEAVEA